jgi:hypothetical protein
VEEHFGMGWVPRGPRSSRSDASRRFGDCASSDHGSTTSSGSTKSSPPFGTCSTTCSAAGVLWLGRQIVRLEGVMKKNEFDPEEFVRTALNGEPFVIEIRDSRTGQITTYGGTTRSRKCRQASAESESRARRPRRRRTRPEDFVTSIETDNEVDERSLATPEGE